MGTKVCSKCDIVKPFEEYRKRSDSIDGLRTECKECSYLMWKKYRDNNSEKLKKLKKQNYINNREKFIEKSKQYREKNIEKIREYDRKRSKTRVVNYKPKPKPEKSDRILLTPEEKKERNKKYKQEHFQKNKKKYLELKRKRRKENPEQYKESNKKYYEKSKYEQKIKKKIWIQNNREKYNSYWTNRKKEDINFKLISKFRSRISRIMKENGYKKKYKTIKLIGCTTKELKEYIEKQFADNMSWENYGLFGWHIDHIIPLSSAKTEEELYKLCHYTNLQPLWAEENIKKSNKIVEPIKNEE